MLQQTKADLEALDAFTPTLPPVVNLVVDSLPAANIPLRMKYIIAVSEITTFASQFRRNIWHWDGFELPINSTSTNKVIWTVFLMVLKV